MLGLELDRGKQRKVVSGLSRYFFELPGLKKTFIISLLTTMITGVIGYAFIKTVHPVWEALLFGSMMGLFFIWLPGIISAFLTNFISTETPRKLTLRRSFYLSFFGIFILSLFYVIGSILTQWGSSLTIVNLLIYGYVVIFVMRVLTIKITHPYTNIEVFGLSLIHPIAGYVFVYFSTYLTFIVTPIPLLIPLSSLVLKAGSSLAILSAGFLLFFMVLNAPMKRNFGVSTFKLTRAILGYWLNESTEVEGIFTQMGEKVDTQANTIVFRERGQEDEIKAIWVVPYLHPGPFEGIGGGKLTEIFTEKIEERFNTDLFIPHSSSTHDLNPAEVNSVKSAANQINDSLEKELGEMNFVSTASKSIREKEKDAKVIGQVIGDTTVTTSTFSPKETDDIDTSLGLAIENILRTDSRGSIHIDAHNCYDLNHTPITSGDTRAYDLLGSSKKVKKRLKNPERSEMKLGTAVNLKDIGEETGKAGIRVSVLETDGQKTCYVVIDSNNVVRGLRDELVEEIKGTGLDEAEIMTTDTHSVNKINSGETPLGTNIDKEELSEEIINTVEEAMNDLEPVEASSKEIKLKDIYVMGKQTEPELISTVNSTIATIKIIGPVIIGSSLILSLAAVLI